MLIYMQKSIEPHLPQFESIRLSSHKYTLNRVDKICYFFRQLWKLSDKITLVDEDFAFLYLRIVGKYTTSTTGFVSHDTVTNRHLRHGYLADIRSLLKNILLSF